MTVAYQNKHKLSFVIKSCELIPFKWIYNGITESAGQLTWKLHFNEYFFYLSFLIQIVKHFTYISFHYISFHSMQKHHIQQIVCIWYSALLSLFLMRFEWHKFPIYSTLITTIKAHVFVTVLIGREQATFHSTYA